MRDYAKVSPMFWTGITGKYIRSLGRDAQVIALYLMTCPSSNMLGLYSLPLPVLCHEIGITEKGALKGLRSLSKGGFCHYDEELEHVWVVEMAHYQIGDSLDLKDNRVKGVHTEIKNYIKCKYYNDFIEKYKNDFHLNDLLITKPLISPSEAPYKPLRSQEQEQEQEQEQKQEQDKPPIPPFEVIRENDVPSPSLAPTKAITKADICSESAKDVLFYLNQKTGNKFRDTTHIRARLKDKYSIQDCFKVIDNKLKDDYFITNPQYLNPITLFRKSNFDKYLNEKPHPLSGSVSNTTIRNISVLDEWRPPQ